VSHSIAPSQTLVDEWLHGMEKGKLEEVMRLFQRLSQDEQVPFLKEVYPRVRLANAALEKQLHQ